VNAVPDLNKATDRLRGCCVIAPRRSYSAHLHRPRRATVRFCAMQFDFAAPLGAVARASSPLT